MTSRKTDKEKPEDRDQQVPADEAGGLIVKEKGTGPEPGFKISDQEGIEYLQEERKETGISRAATSEPRTVQEDLEKAINGLQTVLKEKDQEIAQLKTAVEELKDRYLRSVAELDNIRKRTEREKEEFYQFALSDLFRDILPIIDNFERALKTSEEETDGKTFREGVELIYRMLVNLIKKHGVRPIEIMDNKFDPSLHQALISEESPEVSEPEVKEELQKGYMIHNRLLRPTMVKVIIPKKN